MNDLYEEHGYKLNDYPDRRGHTRAPKAKNAAAEESTAAAFGA